MAQRRPITSHPAFVPLLALWFAMLLGLIVAVLPAPLVERALGALRAGALVPLTDSGRVAAAGGAALAGALLGLALAWPLARRGRRGGRDPRPIYAEPEPGVEDPLGDEPIRRRPLSVREELAEDLPQAWPEDAPVTAADDEAVPALPAEPAPPAHRLAEADEGFMILTPQPVHPSRRPPDLAGLLAQFDTALAAFRAGDEDRPARQPGAQDPVHAFVARQTGTPVPSPLGGRMPDHQAELRAALDKLARAHRQDD